MDFTRDDKFTSKSFFSFNFFSNNYHGLHRIKNYYYIALICFKLNFVQNCPLNIEASRINFHLSNEFKGVFDISYNMHEYRHAQNFNEFNRIDLLTVHFYDALILEKHDERKVYEIFLYC